MSLSIIIVNYNTEELLINCISSIYANISIDNFEIIVVDNGSTDNSLSSLKERFPNVICVCNQKNRGFGTANNQGVAISKYDYLFFLNSDTIIEHDIFSELLFFMQKHQSCAGVTPKIYYEDKKPQNTYGNFPTILFFILNSLGILKILPKKVRNKLSIGIPVEFSCPQRVPHILGVAMFIRKKAFIEVGGFDESFFLYFEETDLCYRMTGLGYDFWVDTNVDIIHLLSKSSPSSLFKIEHMLRSRILYFKYRNVHQYKLIILKFISILKLLLLTIKYQDIRYLKLIRNI